MKERRVHESHIDEIVELIQGEDILLLVSGKTFG